MNTEQLVTGWLWVGECPIDGAHPPTGLDFSPSLWEVKVSMAVWLLHILGLCLFSRREGTLYQAPQHLLSVCVVLSRLNTPSGVS